MKFKNCYLNVFVALFLVEMLFSPATFGQTLNFPTSWVGKWSGKMLIYTQGATKDSVNVEMTINPAEEPNSWRWKTVYLSPKNPITKDYTLKTADAAKGHYWLDEGDGIVLDAYLLGNKLFHLFGVSGLYLTATYELQGDTLVFEVTSGKWLNTTGNDVTNYSVLNLQRSRLRRVLSSN